MARISAIKYRETIWSELYPGSQHTVNCLQPAVLAAENALELAPDRRKCTVIRTDGGAGSDDHIRWLLARDYHVMMKGHANRRAKALAKRVRRWDPFEDYWLGEIPAPVDYGRPVRVFVKRRPKKAQFVYSYYVSTLSLPCKGPFMTITTGGVGQKWNNSAVTRTVCSWRSGENTIYSPRKLFLYWPIWPTIYWPIFTTGRYVAVVLRQWLSSGIVRDLMATPGNLVFEQSKLVRVELLSKKQFSKELTICLERYCSGP